MNKETVTTKTKRPYTKRAYNKKAFVTKNISNDVLDAITYLNNLTVTERAKVISLFN